MAHEIESLFYTREVPWHGLGTRVEESPESEEALIVAGLNWVVNQKPIFVDGQKVEGYSANVRSSDNKTLGIVGKDYKIVQNHEAFAFTDNLIGDGVRYETAGALFGGKKVWLLARLPEQKILGDAVTPYICFQNSHDGKGAIKVFMTPVRVVCNNTLNLALNTTTRSWTTKHVGNMQDKLEQAKITLGFATEYMAELNNTAEVMANKEMSKIQLIEFVNELLLPAKDASDRVKSNVIEMKQEMLTRIYQAPDLAQFRNGESVNQWAVINGISDYLYHKDPLRNAPSYKERLLDKAFTGHELLDQAMKLLKTA